MALLFTVPLPVPESQNPYARIANYAHANGLHVTNLRLAPRGWYQLDLEKPTR